MVAEIGVHDDDEGAACRAQAVHIGRAKAEFAGSWAEEDACGAVEILKLLGNGEGAVRRGVVHDNDLVIEVAGGRERGVSWGYAGWEGNVERERATVTFL